jgi:3,4-dihydroxy 2-butanone 4-phosphate synthase/GTP cyclohydrolase II
MRVTDAQCDERQHLAIRKGAEMTIQVASGLVNDALDALRHGRPVIVIDDEDRENEGDLVVAAEFIDAGLVNLMISEGRGLVCVAAAPHVIARLDLHPMVEANTDSHGTAFTVSVDAIGTGTGISAADRALTIRAIADPATEPEDLRRPGHVFPLRAAVNGVLERRGHTEATVELARMAGLTPVAAICEILDLDGEPAGRDFLDAMADRLSMPVVHVRDIVRAVEQNDQRGRSEKAETSIPTRHGTWTAIAHRAPDGTENLALTLGDLGSVPSPKVRIHSECLTGDVFGSWRCDCGEQLDQAMEAIAAAGAGAVIYLRNHEGRGIGLFNKIRAYSLQEAGLDTVDANLELGFPVDARDYHAAAVLLRELNLTRIDLLTNNLEKVQALVQAGITVDRVTPLLSLPREANRRYLETKRTRLGHQLPVLTDELLFLRRPARSQTKGNASMLTLVDQDNVVVAGCV